MNTLTGVLTLSSQPVFLVKKLKPAACLLESKQLYMGSFVSIAFIALKKIVLKIGCNSLNGEHW